MKKIFFVLILLGAAGWGIFYWLFQEGYFLESPAGSASSVIQEFFEGRFPAPAPEKNLKLYGNVEIRQVLLSFRVPGRIEEMYREEGQSVTPNVLLALLDPLPYEIKQAEARAALHQARANLEKMERGYRTEEIRQAAAQRDQILASLQLAEKDHKRLSHLFSQNALSKKDLDDSTSRRDQLRAQLTSAESALTLTREGFRSEDVKAAKAAVELADAQLREAENSLADTKLYAPSEGTVLTRVTEPGTVVAAGQAVYAVMLKKPVQIRTYVMEPQLGKIRLGMKGKIFTDSQPDPVEGIINFIASEAEFTPKQVQTEDQRADLVYRVRLLVEDPGYLKNGMPVTVFLEE
jgi:HlyD family secretion protein